MQEVPKEAPGDLHVLNTASGDSTDQPVGEPHSHRNHGSPAPLLPDHLPFPTGLHDLYFSLHALPPLPGRRPPMGPSFILQVRVGCGISEVIPGQRGLRVRKSQGS